MVRYVKKVNGATSYKETSFGIIPRAKLLKLELDGTKRGLEFLYDQIEKDKNIRITSSFVCRLHNISFGWIFPKWAGKYRTIRVTYSGKEAPSYVRVPELMINLFDDLEERLKYLPSPDREHFIASVVELIAWFQHRFVFIHPFQDYNGRTARMLTICILLTLHLPPIELKAETGIDRNRYLKSLQNADEGDFYLFETLISQALNESFDRMNTVL